MGRGDAARTLMRKAAARLLWRRHRECVAQEKRSDCDALRSALFSKLDGRKRHCQASWKLSFSQGCNWIQQYSFGPEKYTGSNVFGKLCKCVELLKKYSGPNSVGLEVITREEVCATSTFLVPFWKTKCMKLCQVTKVYEQVKTKKVIPSLLALTFPGNIIWSLHASWWII